ncbi:MAG: Plug domain-containing protein [Saprospiraceae bacterium]|nr:Plug domain-containing protein [Saprospiraceae bacterium]
MGYESIDTVLTANNSLVLFKMTFNNFLDEVQVVAKPTIINLSLHTLTQKDIKNTFPLLGEKDPMKTLQLLPGVQAAQEGTASIFVRGGNPGENLVLLDGVPIHNSNHFFGLISTINPNIISNINFYKGGFPAQYNDKVSSVIDISTHNYLNDTTKIGIGILSSNISLSRNFLSKKVNVQFAVRSTPLSLIKGAYDRIQNINQVVRNGNNVWFYDIYGKVNVAL